MDKKTIKVPYNGKGHRVSYKLETIDLSMTAVGFLNVYNVYIDDPELQEITGDHFTILHNSTQTIKPCFENSGNTEDFNIRKTIAQQIMNNSGE
jgi:hypothetical protein